MTPEERQHKIARYADGPRALESALADAPQEAMTWRPEPGAWSIHEIICHCADTEPLISSRIRILAAEANPVLTAIDQDVWTQTFDYHARSLAPAVDVIRATRAWTVGLLPTLTDEQWTRPGTHTETGRLTAEDWLDTYSQHLHGHADQIRANLAAWIASDEERTSFA